MNTDYLAFEGVDGSGKTSYIEALSSHLEKKSINFKIVREPGGSKLGEAYETFCSAMNTQLSL